MTAPMTQVPVPTAIFITYDAGINGHSAIGVQFFLNEMDFETYAMLLGKWEAGEYTSTKKTSI